MAMAVPKTSYKQKSCFFNQTEVPNCHLSFFFDEWSEVTYNPLDLPNGTIFIRLVSSISI